ncbi:four-helix bundle copper-binding protein [Halorarum halobium]|uniref:four-helix bundle copper-binding protein n=1 Tax=Halorarum halobium TaxID=3075121 RepID=UPI0028AF976C|nr:four-helix bundle copper-binding protein [Halobaculum sp. XH14]
MRLALHDFVQAGNVCEWCADRCLDEGPEMATCVRLCRDVADLAGQNVRFMARDSPFGPELAETFALVAQECANECARHQQDHCRECASVLRRAVDSTWSMLESMERQEATGPQAAQGTQGAQQY